jgi:hypothetical protein
MTTPTATGAGIVQFLSIPVILALFTGIGSFLKTLWDRYSEGRSIAGINRLSEYLDIDGKREEPLLNRETVDLVVYELNLRMREISGSPPSSSIERVERWRRSNVFARAISVPRELRKLQTKESSNLNISTKVFIFIMAGSLSALASWIRQPMEIVLGDANIRIKSTNIFNEKLRQLSSLTPEQIKALSASPEPSLYSSSTIALSIGIALIFVVLVLYIRKTLSTFDRLADAYCREHREKDLAQGFNDSLGS